MKPLNLAICTGDYNGIGPEIIIKALTDTAIQNICGFSIFGNASVFENTFKRFSSSLRIKYTAGLRFILNNLYRSSEILTGKKIEFNPGTPSLNSGSTAYLYLLNAVDYWKCGGCGGIVTGPVIKHTFFPKGAHFCGQTEWIAHQVDCDKSLMMMITHSLRIALVTTHYAVKDLPKHINTENITQKGRMFYESLIADFGITEPKIAVCAFNPHGGEAGQFGSEETEIIEPAIETLKNGGGAWSGPHSADSLFVKSKTRQYDGILAMYHDQGLTPFKAYSGLQGVNFTAGLPLVRTSPDHGPAMDIAGSGKADETSFKEAIKLAVEIAKRRAVRC